MAAATSKSSQAARWRQRLAILVGASLVFGIAHTQAPLYFSNQHQYFVHGLAAGGAGLLKFDWLASTLDPTPVFSAMVGFVYRWLHVLVFHAIFLILLGIYFVSLLALGGLLIPRGPSRRFSMAALGIMLIVVHAGIVRLASARLFGVDYPWYFQAGLAGQYVMGPGLQPSAFGVLLIGSIAAFAHGRLALSVACSSIACTIHATYLLPAAMFTLAYMIVLYREGRSRAAILVGAGSLLTVLPVVLWSAYTFGPTSPAIFAQAETIVAELRIPHHALIRRWLDPIAGLQIAWIVLSLIVLRRTRLFLILGIPTLLSALLTLLQYATGDLTLALLFPWRTSVILLPIATCAIFARLACLVPNRSQVRLAMFSAAALVLVGGIAIQVMGLAFGANESELPALQFIHDNKQAGDVYLLPVQLSKAGARGVTSASFMPPPRGQAKGQIAVDFQRFRLFTEAPLYVDFKSIPYKDADVLEWRRRLDKCLGWYDTRNWNNPEVRGDLLREGITHVIIQADRPIEGDEYELLFADQSYRIYRVRR